MDPLSLLSLVGGLGGGGGGSTSQQTTVSSTNSLNNSFTPVNSVTLGGGFSSSPYAPVSGNPIAQAAAGLTPNGQQPSFNSFADPYAQSAPKLLSGNLPIIAAAAVVGFLLFTSKGG